jgi:hypothetical protein
MRRHEAPRFTRASGIQGLRTKMLSFASSYTNDPSRKGQLAARKQLFGDYRRYAIAPIHTRFDAVSWFVWDADGYPMGEPAVIRQEATLAKAIANL